MINLRKIIVAIFILVLPINTLFANEKTAYVDIDYIFQNSNIGKKTLNAINDLNKKNINQLEKKNKNLKDLETSILNKKNIISENEYNNEVKVFKQKVNKFTEEKDKTVNDFNAFRKNELEKIFKLFRPIISNYMEENSIDILLDSKNVFMANDNLNLTEDILKIINNKL